MKDEYNYLEKKNSTNNSFEENPRGNIPHINHPSIQLRKFNELLEANKNQSVFINSLPNDEANTLISQGNVKCNGIGVFMDHSNESRYYRCTFGQITYERIHETCPDNYIFSMADERCIKLGTGGN